MSDSPDPAIDFLRRRLEAAILARDSVTAARLIAQLDQLLNGELAQ
jgi:hypothetical protein